MIKILDSEKNISISDITQIENKIGITFPDNLKKLLLKFNGGYIEDHEDIDTLLSIKYGKQTIEYFIEMHNRKEKNIPDNFLPFALDWSDNPITLNLSDGKVVLFYFDEEDEPETIANSLEEVLGVKNIDEL